MMNFKSLATIGRLTSASAIALGCAGLAAANDSTEAGRSVSNTFVLEYSVGSVNQAPITNKALTDPDFPTNGIQQGTPTLFTVDRKVDLSITATNTTLTTAPNNTVTLTYELVNNGNDNQAYSFSLADLDNGANTFDGTVNSITYYIDVADDGFGNDTGVAITQTVIGADPDTPNAVDVTADVPKGISVLIEVEVDVSGSETDATTDDITLVAETRNPFAWVFETIAAADRSEVTQGDTGANTRGSVAQNVLADLNGGTTAETDNDGLFAVVGRIQVESPELDATKDVSVISEVSAGCATATLVANAKAIPGACVEYVIEVENTGATATASGITITDVLPNNVTFVSASLASGPNPFDDTGDAITPALSFPTTPATRACDGTDATCEITLSDGVLQTGETGQIIIRATVD